MSDRAATPSWRELAWAGLLFTLLTCTLAPDAAIGASTFWTHDFRHHHDPWRAWAASRWAVGQVPWWASGAANGFPLLAEGEGGFLYPPTMLLYVLLPDALALSWAVLGHAAWAMLGLYAYLRAIGLRRSSAALGGVAWGFSGFLISHALYLGMQNAAAWLGWGLFAAASGRAWLVAVTVAMLGLAGHPQAAAFGGLLLGLHALGTRRGAWWYGGAAVGGLIALPQLLATLQLARDSMRSGGVDAVFANIGAQPLPELVKAVLPYAFGFDRPADVVRTYMHRGPGYWGPGVNSWETTFYLGVPVVVLGLVGVWHGGVASAAGMRARRGIRGWLLVGLVGLLLMLGGPTWELVRHLPGLDGFRFPARFALWVTLASAVLAAQGAEALRTLTRTAGLSRALIGLAAAFTLATGTAHLVLRAQADVIMAVGERALLARAALPPPPPPVSDPLAAAALPPPEVDDPAEIPAKVRRIHADLLRSTSAVSPRVWGPFLLLVGTALLLRRPRALVALVAADLWAFGHGFHPTTPADVTRARPAWLSEAMTQPGGPRLTVVDRRQAAELDPALLSASMGLPMGTNDVVLPTPLLLPRNDAVLAAAGLDIAGEGESQALRYLSSLSIARRLGVRWVATTHRLGGLVPVVRGPVNVFEDPAAVPRARVVPCVDGVADVTEAIAALGASDPLRTVVVEGAPDACVERPGAVEVLAYADTRVELRAEGPGTLVLADTYLSGWTASIDGTSAPILRADVLFRAVTLPSGTHTVLFAYDPGLAGRALPLSALLWGAVAAAAVWRERRYSA